MTYKSPNEALKDIFGKMLNDYKITLEYGYDYEDFLSKNTMQNDIFISCKNINVTDYGTDFSYNGLKLVYEVNIRSKNDIWNLVGEVMGFLNMKQYREFQFESGSYVIDCKIKTFGGNFLRAYDCSYFNLNIEILW